MHLLDAGHRVNLLVTYNPFKLDDRTIAELDWAADRTLAEYLEGLPGDAEWVVVVNGKAVEAEDWASTRLQPEDWISIVPVPLGGGGNNGKMILRMVAMLALTIAAPHVGGALGIAAEGWAMTVFEVAFVAVGSLLINALAPAPKTPSNEDDSSPTYGIDGAKMTEREGVPVPIIYGEWRTPGFIGATYTENLENTQYLYVQQILSEGEISDITDIRINDQPAENYQQVEHVKRFGAPGQSIPDWFNDTYNMQPKGITLDTSFTRHTTTMPVDKLRIDLLFPTGLTYYQKDGDRKGHFVDVELRYRKEGTTQWQGLFKAETQLIKLDAGVTTTPETTKISVEAQASEPTWMNIWDATPVNMLVEYRKVGTTEWQTLVSATETLPAMRYAQGEADVYVPPTFSRQITREVPYGEYEFRTGAQTSITSLSYASTGNVIRIDGKTTQPLRRSFTTPLLDQGVYEVEVRRLTPELESDKYFEKVQLADVVEIVVDDVAFVHTAYLGTRIKLDEQLTGGPTITALVKGVKCDHYDWEGNVVETKTTANPAWIAIDILKRVRYPLSRLDMAKFVEWAEHCQNKNLWFNGVFDRGTNVWDALQLVFKVGHAMAVPVGTKFSVTIDKPAEPVMVFNVGNINAGSLRLNWLPRVDRANEIEITFYNKEKFHEQDFVRVVDDAALLRGDPQRTSAIEILGIDNFEQAWLEGHFQMAQNRFIGQSATWSSPLEAISCNIGDVVLLQHDMPQWGFGGRLEAGSTKSVIRLDRDVERVAGKNYALLVIRDAVQRHTGVVTAANGSVVTVDGFTSALGRATRIRRGSDDFGIARVFSNGNLLVPAHDLAPGDTVEIWDTEVIEERPVVNDGENNAVVTLASDLPIAPERFTKFLFGEVAKIAKPFRITRIDYGSDSDSRNITAVEYNESIYDDPEHAIPTPNYSSLQRGIGQATLRNAFAEALISGDARRHYLTLSWNKPSYGAYDGAEIHLSVSSDEFFVEKVVTGGATSTRIEVLPGQNIRYKIIARSATGERASLEGATIYEFNLPKQTEIGQGITGVTAQGGYQNVTLRWTNPALEHFKHAEIWWSTTNNRASASLLTKVAGTQHVVSGLANAATYYFWLRAVTNEDGLSDWSHGPTSGISATTQRITQADLDTTPPANPTGLAIEEIAEITTDGYTISKLRATWNAGAESDLAGYEWRMDANNGVYVYGTVPSNTLEQPVTAGKTYRVWVRAFDFANNKSAWVGPVTRAVVGDTVAPGACSGLTAAGGLGSILLKWTNPLDADLHHVEVWASSTNSRTAATLLAEVAGTTYSHTGLNSLETRYYWVRAVDRSQNVGAWYPTSATAGVSATTSANVTDTIPPAVPTGLTLTSTLNADGTVKLVATWTGGTEDDFAHFDIELKEGTGNYVSFITGSNRREWTVQPNKAFSARVRAFDTSGNRSAFSTVATHTTVQDTAPPHAITAATAKGTFQSVWLEHTPATTGPTYAHVEIWESSTNNRANATLIERATSLKTLRGDLPNDATRYYWWRPVSISGIAGPWYPTSATAGISAKTNRLVEQDLAEGAVKAINLDQSIRDEIDKVSGMETAIGALESADTQLAQDIANEASARATAISNEASARATAISTEVTNRTNAIAAEASARATAISNEATARAAEIKARAEEIAGLAISGNAAGVIRSATTPGTADRTKLWIDTSSNPPTLKYWNGSAWVADSGANIKAVATRVSTAEGDISAHGSSISSLTTRVGNVEGSITSQSSAITALESGFSDIGVWTLDYTVSGTISKVLIHPNGSPLGTGGGVGSSPIAYTVEARVLSTSNVTGFISRFSYDGNAWSVEHIRYTELTNGPLFFINEEGRPAIRLNSHESTYTVRVKTTRHNSHVTPDSVNASAIQSLDTRTTATEGAVTAQSTAITNLETRMTSAEGVNSGQATAINGLETRVTAAEGTLSSQATSITSLEAGLSGTQQWTSIYNVNNTESGANRLLNADGSLLSSGASNGGAQRTSILVEARVLGISAVTGRLARFTYNGSIWILEEIASTGTTASMPVFYLHEGVPAVRLQSQAIALQVEVKHERHFLPTDVGKVNATAISGLDTRVTAAEGTISSQASAITSLTSRIGAAEGVNDTQATAIDGLDTRVTAAEGSISSQSTAITVLETSFGRARRWGHNYATNTQTHQKLRNSDGTSPLRPLPPGYETTGVDGVLFVCSARTIGTSTPTGIAVNFVYNGSAWAMETVYRRAATSNHPEFFIDEDGDPALRLYANSTLYTVEVVIEQHLTSRTQPRLQAEAIQSLDTRVTDAEGALTSQATSITSLETGLEDTHRWVNVYDDVAPDNPVRLRERDGTTALRMGGSNPYSSTGRASFIVEARLVGGSVGTSVVARVVFNGSNWSVEEIFRNTSVGGSPEFVIAHGGWPCVRVLPPVSGSSYQVEVLHERHFSYVDPSKVNANAIQSLDTRVTAAEGTISSQATAITNLTSRIGAAEGVNDTQATAISGLDTRVSANESAISSHSTSITRLSSEIGEVGVWSYQTNVNATTSRKIERANEATPLLTGGGSGSSRIAYTVEGTTLSTSSATGYISRFVYNGSAWSVQHIRRGSVSNGPDFFIDEDGHPAVKLISHETLYTVRIKVTQHESYQTPDSINATAIQSLDTRVTSAEGTISSQATSITDLTSRIGAAEGVNDAQATAISGLDTRVTAAESTISSQSTSITSLEAGLENTHRWVNVYEGVATNNAVRIRDPDGTSLSMGGDTPYGSPGRASFIVEARTLGVSGSSTTARVRFNGSVWSVEKIFEASTGEGHPEIVIADQGWPCVRLYGSSTTPRDVEVLHERHFSYVDPSKANATAISAIDTRVTATEGTISSQATAITNLTSRIGAAEGVNSTQATAINNLDTRVTATENSISSHSTSITSLQAGLEGTHQWTTIYNVNNEESAAGRLRNADGTLLSSGATGGGAQRTSILVEARVPGISTVTGRLARFSYDGTNWSVEVLATSGSTASMPVFYLRAGLPAVRLQSQGSTLAVEVKHERHLLNTDIGKINATAIQSLDTRVTSAEGTISSQSSSITSLTNRIDAAEGVNDAQATALSGLDSRVTATESSISSQASAITSLRSDLDDVGVWTRTYSVSVTNHSVLQNENGTTPLRTGGASGAARIVYSAEATTLGTGTATGTIAEISYNGSAWSVEQIAGGTTSNHPEFFIDSEGRPALKLWTHPSNYSVRVKLTRHESFRTRGQVNASAIQSLDTRVTDAEGTISAHATSISSLSTTVGNHTTTISQHASSINGIEGKWTVKTDTNGYISGFGLISTANTATPSSEFFVLADKFKIASPGATAKAPFVVESGKVYIDNAVIKASSISAEQIAVGTFSDNLILNGGAEAELSGVCTGNLSSVSSNAIVTTNSWSRSGSRSFVLRGNPTFDTTDGVNMIMKAVPVSPGRTYTIRFWAYNGIATTNGLYCRMAYSSSKPTTGYLCYSSSSNRVDPSDIADNYQDLAGLTNAPLGTGWTLYERVWTAPANAYYVSINFLKWITNVATRFYFDDIEMREQIDSVHIKDGAITAAKVTTGELITASAQIRDAIINDGHVANLSAAKLTAGTALAATITVSGTALSTIRSNAATGAQDPADRINAASTLIDPGKIRISGSTTLASWQKGGDVTKIDGGAISANTITANKLTIGVRGVDLIGIEFEHNSPSTNRVSWTAGSIAWTSESGSSTSVSITAGSTGTWSSGTFYIYWDKGSTTLSYGTSHNSSSGDDRIILAVYRGGTNLISAYGRTIIDGDHIKTGTVDTHHLKADSVTASVIAAEAIEGHHLKAQSITAGHLSIGFDAGGNLVSNPGAEGNTTDNWIMYGTPTLTPYTTTKISGRYSFRMNGNSGYAISRAFAVRPGEKLSARAFFRGYNQSSTSGFYFRLYFTAAQPSTGYIGANGGNHNTYDALVNVAPANSAISTAWGVYDREVEVPSNVYWCSVAIYNWTDGPSNGLLFDDVEVRRQTRAVQIADGAVRAEKIAAEAVLAGHIKAGEITGDHLAADTVVANKNVYVGSSTAGASVQLNGHPTNPYIAVRHSNTQFGVYMGISGGSPRFIARKSDGTDLINLQDSTLTFGNDLIVTGNIVANAVTIGDTVFTAAQYVGAGNSGGLREDGVWETLQTINVAAGQGNVLMWVQMLLRSTSVSSTTMIGELPSAEIRVRRASDNAVVFGPIKSTEIEINHRSWMENDNVRNEYWAEAQMNNLSFTLMTSGSGNFYLEAKVSDDDSVQFYASNRGMTYLRVQR